MKNFIVVLLTVFLASCAVDSQHPDFEKHVELGKNFFKLHGEEKFDEMKDLLSDDLSWTSPAYGEGLIDKETQLGYIKMYQDNYENVTFTANYWLPGVDTLSLKNDGSVRVYGTWSGVHSSTGNEFSLGSYHTMAFDADGKISGGGDWFDLTGFIQQSQKVSDEEVME